MQHIGDPWQAKILEYVRCNLVKKECLKDYSNTPSVVLVRTCMAYAALSYFVDTII